MIHLTIYGQFSAISRICLDRIRKFLNLVGWLGQGRRSRKLRYIFGIVWVKEVQHKHGAYTDRALPDIDQSIELIYFLIC